MWQSSAHWLCVSVCMYDFVFEVMFCRVWTAREQLAQSAIWRAACFLCMLFPPCPQHKKTACAVSEPQSVYLKQSPRKKLKLRGARRENERSWKSPSLAWPASSQTYRALLRPTSKGLLLLSSSSVFLYISPSLYLLIFASFTTEAHVEMKFLG